MAELLVDIRLGTGVLHRYVLRFACWVAAHDVLVQVRLLGVWVEANSIFDVVGVINVIEVLLVDDVARVGLLEGSRRPT